MSNSATYQTQLLDTSQIDVPAHPDMSDVEALDMVLQIANPNDQAGNAGNGWNLNKILRYIRCQRKEQSVAAGLTQDAPAPDAEDDMVVADLSPAKTMENLRELIAALVTDAEQPGGTGAGHDDNGVAQTASYGVPTPSGLTGQLYVGSAEANATGAAVTTNGSGVNATVDIAGGVVTVNTAGSGYAEGDTITVGGDAAVTLVAGNLWSGSSRGDWAQRVNNSANDTSAALATNGVHNANSQADAAKAYDIVDACALAIAFAWSKGGAAISSGTAGNTEREATFKKAKDFRAQIADNQIKYDLNQFAGSGTDVRSKLFAALENQSVKTAANTGLDENDFHANDKRHLSMVKSQGAAWLSMLGARIVAHSLREDFNTLAQRRMAVYGGTDAGAPGLNTVVAAPTGGGASPATGVITQGADPFDVVPGTDGESRYFDSSDSDNLAANVPTGLAADAAEAYGINEVRYQPALQADDNICLAFNFRVTNSQATGNSTARDAKVGFVIKQGTAGSIVVADGSGTDAPGSAAFTADA